MSTSTTPSRKTDRMRYDILSLTITVLVIIILVVILARLL